jgi:hypothetical protein
MACHLYDAARIEAARAATPGQRSDRTRDRCAGAAVPCSGAQAKMQPSSGQSTPLNGSGNGLAASAWAKVGNHGTGEAKPDPTNPENLASSSARDDQLVQRGK